LSFDLSNVAESGVQAIVAAIATGLWLRVRTCFARLVRRRSATDHGVAPARVEQPPAWSPVPQQALAQHGSVVVQAGRDVITGDTPPGTAHRWR